MSVCACGCVFVYVVYIKCVGSVYMYFREEMVNNIIVPLSLVKSHRFDLITLYSIITFSRQKNISFSPVHPFSPHSVSLALYSSYILINLL